MSWEGTGSTDPVAANQDAVWSGSNGQAVGVIANRTAKTGVPGQPFPAVNGTYVRKLQKSTGSFGGGALLKVMSGDVINTSVDYYYNTTSADNRTANGLSTMVASLLAAITGSPAVSAGAKAGASSATTSMGTANSTADVFLSGEKNSTATGQAPEAYLHVLLFNEQFVFDNANSYVQRVSVVNAVTNISKSVSVKKNGYAYIYFSNESESPVWFDNLQLNHVRGAILEETHYYPFGLTMSGISSKAAGGVENRKKYNGIELDEDLDLDVYEAYYRNLDPQTGRWWQIDPQCEPNEDLDEPGLESLSPYNAMANDPVRYSDPLGDEPDDDGSFWSKVKGAVDHVVAVGLGVADAFGADNSLGAMDTHSAGQVGYSGSKGTAYEIGQDLGHAAALVQGVVEDAVAGSGEVASVGLATPVAVPLAVHSTALLANTAKNMLKSAVNANSSNSGSSSNSSNKQRNAPQQNGTPNSSKIESKDANGKTTKYSTYNDNGKIKKQVQIDPGSTRHGVSGATKKVPNYNTNPNTGQKFINGYKVKKAMPAETPPGTN